MKYRCGHAKDFFVTFKGHSLTFTSKSCVMCYPASNNRKETFEIDRKEAFEIDMAKWSPGIV